MNMIERAESEYARGRLRKALLYFLAAIEENPEDASAHLGAGRCLYHLGRIDEAETRIDNALRLNEQLAPALYRVQVRHRPRLLSDNGPCYVSGELRRFLESQRIEHTRGAPYHPMTQGKIERYHRSMKNLIQLQNYAFPWDLERQIGCFVDYYNHQRYHESLNNVTPADAYFGRAKEVLTRREEIKRKTLDARRRQHTQSRQMAA
jgi:tetratricopeptide (TPR) repeat protein